MASTRMPGPTKRTTPASARAIGSSTRPGMKAGRLAVEYQRIITALADQRGSGDGTMTCQQIASALGLEPTPGVIEGAVRSRAKARDSKRLVARGWLAEPAPGRFTLVDGPASGS